MAYTNGIAVFAIGTWIAYEAVVRRFEPEPVLGGPMLVIAVLGLLVNIAGFLILRGGQRDSLNMRGALLHVLGDMLGSVAAIAAALIIMATGWTPIDPILSVLVAVLLFRSAWSLVREAGHLLLEGVPTSLDRDIIARDIERNVSGVREVHHMHVWSLDGSKNMATLHACLSDGADPHAAVVAIKRRLEEQARHRPCDCGAEYGACADPGAANHGADHRD